jgi:hypothetical protein
VQRTRCVVDLTVDPGTNRSSNGTRPSQVRKQIHGFHPRRNAGLCEEGVLQMVLPYIVLLEHPKQLLNLRISPMGIVPQRGRRPRIIVDYSFYDLNAQTVKLAPQEAMQFGKALQRIIRGIVEANPRFGPVNLLKVDIADGFYRIWLNTAGIPKLAVAIPSLDHKEPMLGLPCVLPMGWTELPPYFGADSHRRHQRASEIQLGPIGPPARQTCLVITQTRPCRKSSRTFSGTIPLPLAAHNKPPSIERLAHPTVGPNRCLRRRFYPSRPRERGSPSARPMDIVAHAGRGLPRSFSQG